MSLLAPASGQEKPEVPRPPGTARIMTWNVQHACAERSRRQAEWLASTDTDVVVLTEVAAGDGGAALTQALSDRGFRTLTSSAGPGHARDYRVLVACRGGAPHPVEAVTTVDLPHRFLAVRVRLTSSSREGVSGSDGDGIRSLTSTFTTRSGDVARSGNGDVSLLVAGLYVPSRGPQHRRNVDKRAFQSAVTALLPALAAARTPEESLVVTGDLNVLERGHVPAHTNFGAWEYAFYDSFAAHGLIDAFRHLHPRAVEHSWFGRRSGAGYRFDHLFIDQAHAAHVVACHYDHRPRRAGLSDHSALAAVIDLSTEAVSTAR